LYFLRHGLADRSAYAGTDDRLRPLTEKGKRRLKRQGQTLARLGFSPDLILTSPLTRALQTAEIVAGELGIQDRCRLEPGLACGFDREDLARVLEANPEARELVLVGHEPDFSSVVSGLIGGGQLICKKGSLVRVDLLGEAPPYGELVWLVPPKLLAL
jgi:phosphohistidine phosphatase